MNDETTKKKDLGTQGQKDALKGKVNQAAGKVQKKVGQVVGDPAIEAKGKAREVAGKARSKVGDLEQKSDRKLKGEETV